MPTSLRKLLKNQPQVTVVAHTQTNPAESFRFAAFFAAFAGIFFFFSSNLWHALTGG